MNLQQTKNRIQSILKALIKKLNNAVKKAELMNQS